LLEPVVGCGLKAQNANRNPLYHTNMEALHVDDYSVSHKLHGYLLNDALLLCLPQRIRSKSISMRQVPPVVVMVMVVVGLLQVIAVVAMKLAIVIK
jgi:hypothetical protein